MSTSFHWVFAAFFAPALFVGFALASLPQRGKNWARWLLQGGVNALCGIVALLAVLWLTGQDGTLMGYTALCLAAASSQWWMSRARA